MKRQFVFKNEFRTIIRWFTKQELTEYLRQNPNYILVKPSIIERIKNVFRKII